jgi:hypothetical protein
MPRVNSSPFIRKLSALRVAKSVALQCSETVEVVHKIKPLTSIRVKPQQAYGKKWNCYLICVHRVWSPVGRVAYSDWLRAGRSGDRIPVGSEIFRACPDRPCGPPSLLYNGYRALPRGKERLGCDTDPLPPSSTVVKKG